MLHSRQPIFEILLNEVKKINCLLAGIRVTFIDTDPRDNPISSHVAPCSVDAALLAVNCLFNIPQKPRKRSLN